MNFADKMKNILDKGIEASRDILEKASSQAQTWGEQGMLKIEINQLNSQAQKLTTKLGAEIYEAFSGQGIDSIPRDAPQIEPLLRQIHDLETLIDKKEEAFRKLGGKQEDLDNSGRPD